MPVAILYSRALAGMDAPQVTVEAHIGNGLPSFTIVGLAEAEVKESRDRVRAAIVNSQFEFPARRVTINLAPADLPKESGRFDLAIALGILAASRQIPATRIADHEFAGELSLTGELRPVRGALAMTWFAARSGRAFVLPSPNAPEAALVEDAEILPARSLLEVCAHLAGREPLARYHGTTRINGAEYPDLSDVKGQAQAKRALEICAAGDHSLLMFGPPGTGKSMLAARFPGLLPAMSREHALESAALQSLGSDGFRVERFGQRPYRSPHHTSSAVALVGGGSNPRPGEISLAHHGVLFLDELPEFDRRVLEVLREPLESGRIHISRAARQAEFPARFQLVAAMNPCPCGYLGHFNGKCRCTPDQVARYRGRISGPLLDRIDLTVEVPAVPQDDLMKHTVGESSGPVRERAERARVIQLSRQGIPNSALETKKIERFCTPDAAGIALLKQAMSRLDLSARAYHRVLKVARSIADLMASETVRAPHIAEAVQYRRFT